MQRERTVLEGMTKAINIMVMEDSWDKLSTKEIASRILAEMGEPERIATLDGELISCYIVSRSRT